MTAAPTIAALYVDPKGPYPSMPGVDAWDAERDARNYDGPHPIVAHPPCGPWGKLAHMCTRQDRNLAPLAVEQLIRWGGVLEHPAESRLWHELGLPVPGGLPQVRGGRELWALQVDQCRWGHPCRKPTNLLFADVPRDAVGELPLWIEPVAAVTNSGRSGEPRPYMANRRRATAAEARQTPQALAEWLIGLARTVPPASVAQPPASLDVVRVVVFGEVVWGARFRDPDLEHPQGPGSSWVVWGDDFGQSLVPDQAVTRVDEVTA